MDEDIQSPEVPQMIEQDPVELRELQEKVEILTRELEKQTTRIQNLVDTQIEEALLEGLKQPDLGTEVETDPIMDDQRHFAVGVEDGGAIYVRSGVWTHIYVNSTEPVSEDDPEVGDLVKTQCEWEGGTVSGGDGKTLIQAVLDTEAETVTIETGDYNDDESAPYGADVDETGGTWPLALVTGTQVEPCWEGGDIVTVVGAGGGSSYAYDGPFPGTIRDNEGNETLSGTGVNIGPGNIWAGGESYYDTGNGTAFKAWTGATFTFGDYKSDTPSGAYTLGFEIDVFPDTGDFRSPYIPALVAHKTSDISSSPYSAGGNDVYVHVQGASHVFVELGTFDFVSGSDVAADVYSNWLQTWQGTRIHVPTWGWDTGTAGGMEIVDEVDPDDDWDADHQFTCSFLSDYRPIFKEVKEYVDYEIRHHSFRHVISGDGAHTSTGSGVHSHTPTDLP